MCHACGLVTTIADISKNFKSNICKRNNRLALRILFLRIRSAANTLSPTFDSSILESSFENVWGKPFDNISSKLQTRQSIVIYTNTGSLTTITSFLSFFFFFFYLSYPREVFSFSFSFFPRHRNTNAQQTQQQMRDLRSTQLPTEGAGAWLYGLEAFFPLPFPCPPQPLPTGPGGVL